jgi:hypothetical protein
MLNGVRRRNNKQVDTMMLRTIIFLGLSALLLVSLAACAARPGFGPGWGAGWGHGWGMTSAGYGHGAGYGTGYGAGSCAGYASGQPSFR